MFVMQHFRLTWEDALQYVQNRRYCISPNGGFLTQLKVSAPYSSSSPPVILRPLLRKATIVMS